MQKHIVVLFCGQHAARDIVERHRVAFCALDNHLTIALVYFGVQCIRTIYALLNEPRSGVPSGFAHFCQLPKGQKIILRYGLLPRTANMNVRDVIVNRE